MNFKDPRGFVCMMLSIYAIPLLAWGFADADAFLFGSGLAAAVVVGAALVLNHTPPHGRGRTLRSRTRRRLAWLLVAPVRDCGCFKSEGADTVETDTFVARTMDGGRVRFEARSHRLRRCHNCGRHYHDTANSRTAHVGDESRLKQLDTTGSLGIHRETVVWPEDEPEVYDAVEVDIEDTP